MRIAASQTTASSSPRVGNRVGRYAVFTSVLSILMVLGVSGTALAQLKTATGFSYPNGRIPDVQMCGGWLARDAAHGGCYTDGQYHIGADIETPLDGPVYPVADGTVLFKSVGGWGTGNVGIVIR